MVRMLIVADDLTGAADCAVACAGYGLRSFVALDDCRDCDADLLAIDANTRNSEPGWAKATTARLVREYAYSDETLVYKKVDSIMRGNVAAEIAGALKARRAICSRTPQTRAVLAPAFPANGRTTVNGRVLVRGIPLRETDLWRYEPTAPPSNLMEMMSATGLRCALVNLAAVRRNDLQQTMADLASDADVLICDAETDEDLAAIAEASMSLFGRSTVWAGSAGLAYHLPSAARLRGQAAAPPTPVTTGPTLFVVGSGSSVSHRQAEILESRPDIVSVRVTRGVLCAGDELPEWRAHRAVLERAFSAGVDSLVMVAAEEHLSTAQEPLLANALGELVRPFGDAAGALVATGGETARAVLRGWGIARLEILGEVEPGLPYSIATGQGRLLPVLTKAGGFGRPETFLHCRQFLQSLGRGDALPTTLSKGHV
jgi:uncharacterized protein YgbK (DUF1537 family)